MDGRFSRLRVSRRGIQALSGVAVLALTLAVAGCNVFGGIAPAPKTVDTLVADAESALATGETAQAVRLFERAFAKDSTDVRVRVGLANALYADREFDLFAVRRAADHLIGGGTASGAAGKTASTPGIPSAKTAACTDRLRPDPGTDRYARVPLDAAPIRRLVDRASVIDRVRRLVVSGVLHRSSEVLSSVEPSVRRKALLVGAVTVVARRTLEVRSVFGEVGGTLFLEHPSSSGRALVSCAPSDGALRELHRALCRLGAAAEQGRRWLRTRSGAAAGDQEDPGLVLGERLRTLSDVVHTRIDCSQGR